MNNTFGDLQETIGGALMPVLIPMVETLSKIVSTMLDWANKVPFLTSVITIVVVALGGLLLVLGPLLMVMPGIAAVVTMTGLSFGGLAAGIGAAVVAAAPFLLVGAAIAALAYLIYDNWDDIVVFFEYVFSNMWEIVQKYWEWILLIIFPAGGIVALFIEHWEPIKEFFTGLWESVKDIFTDAWDTLYDVFVTSRIDAAKAAWNAIMEYFTGLWNNVANVFQSAWDTIVTTITEPYDIMVDVWQPIAGFFAGLWDDIQSTFDTVWRAIEGTVESVASYFESAWDSSIGWVISLFEDLWDTANDVLGAIMDKINAVIDGIRDAASRLDDATGGIVGDIWGAVTGMPRAEGGPVSKGSPYIVGEKGPELFVPNTSGNVIPNNALGGGNNMTINMNGITIREEADIDKIARALRREWEQTAMLGA
ncbi:MAG: hypothetical protein GY833_01320, partial [Aestuariibacter sp.]|nr:hypothetical protein [Aestuariibacter sp.]